MIVKVCGLREPHNTRQVAALGVDWMGFIFYAKSPRAVTTPVPPEATGTARRVGVFVNADAAFITRSVEQWELHMVQLHGHETPQQVNEVRTLLPQVQVMKAISVSTVADIAAADTYDGIAHYLLFDTRCVTVGGSGRQFDWSILRHYRGTTPFLLSGGIGPDDAQRVLAFSHPQCVGIDVNSRFETAPGHKDVQQLQRFIQSIRRQ